MSSYRDQITRIYSGSHGNDRQVILKKLEITTGIWVAFTVGCQLYLYSTNSYHDIPSSLQWLSKSSYLLSGNSTLFGALYALISMSTTEFNEKKFLSLLIIHACIINTVTQYLIYFGLSLDILVETTQFQNSLTRIASWIATAPFLIYIIGELTECRKESKELEALTYLVLASGAVSVLTDSTNLYIISSLFFLKLMWILNDVFEKSREKNSAKLDLQELQTLHATSLISFLLFPITYGLVKFHVIPFALGELSYSIGNILSKVVLLVIIVNSSMTKIQSEKQVKLKDLSLEMAQDLMMSEEILRKMMPQPMFQHLLEDLATFKNASLFYADINFLDATVNDAQKQYKIVSNLWKECDSLANNYGIANLQTSGHSYLAIIGANIPDNQHAIKCVQFALDVQKIFKQRNLGESVEIRFGIASGDVQAINLSGDSNHPKWDIIGQTAELTKMLLTSSTSFRIHISESTYHLCKDSFSIRKDVLSNQVGGENVVAYWVYGPKLLTTSTSADGFAPMLEKESGLPRLPSDFQQQAIQRRLNATK